MRSGISTAGPGIGGLLSRSLAPPLHLLGLCLLLVFSNSILAQADPPLSIDSLDSIEIPELLRPLCFGFRDISELRALSICDALDIDLNVKARELSEQWLRAEPDSVAAQFTFAEILFTVEGNMPRALFHLKLAEELGAYDNLEQAYSAGDGQWYYLTLSQLSYVHQLMGDQLKSLEYLDKINQFYGIDMESFRGWPLIKLKEYDAARTSANRVLQSSNDERERARAWNTLCAVELASLTPIDSMAACDRAIDEDEGADASNDYDTVYLSNASEVSLSLLQMDKAEAYLDRATRYLNSRSVADPWIYKLYLTMSQGRFDEAREALDRMLVWRGSQDPIASVMNRAEHFLVSASFLLLAGYAEDAIRLSSTALSQPDRNGSYSAGDEQKDSAAALLNMVANRSEYQIRMETIATMDWTESMGARVGAARLLLDAWRAERRAASIFADFEVLQNRVRPYAPLDVHIPEWIEPEIIAIIGSGIMSSILEQARDNGAFMLNDGYYYSYLTEIAALESQAQETLSAGALALARLPAEEVLLKARVSAHMANAAWRDEQFTDALSHYEAALRQDPSILRRLYASIPVIIDADDSDFSKQVEKYLARSPRFRQTDAGLILEISAEPDLSICLNTRTGTKLSCYTMLAVDNQSSKWNAQQLTRKFHTETFGLGYDISKAQRSILLGSSVILSSQLNTDLQQNRDAILVR